MDPYNATIINPNKTKYQIRAFSLGHTWLQVSAGTGKETLCWGGILSPSPALPTVGSAPGEGQTRTQHQVKIWKMWWSSISAHHGLFPPCPQWRSAEKKVVLNWPCINPSAEQGQGQGRKKKEGTKTSAPSSTSLPGSAYGLCRDTQTGMNQILGQVESASLEDLDPLSWP